MTTSLRLRAGLAAIAVLAVAACGDKARDDNATTTTTRLDAVDVPQGTISDELMPLDTRNESGAPSAAAASNDTGDTSNDAGDKTASAPTATKLPAEVQTGATDSKSETQ